MNTDDHAAQDIGVYRDAQIFNNNCKLKLINFRIITRTIVGMIKRILKLVDSINV